jgi:hypothetical protein
LWRFPHGSRGREGERERGEPGKLFLILWTVGGDGGELRVDELSRRCGECEGGQPWPSAAGGSAVVEPHGLLRGEGGGVVEGAGVGASAQAAAPERLHAR